MLDLIVIISTCVAVTALYTLFYSAALTMYTEWLRGAASAALEREYLIYSDIGIAHSIVIQRGPPPLPVFFQVFQLLTPLSAAKADRVRQWRTTLATLRMFSAATVYLTSSKSTGGSQCTRVWTVLHKSPKHVDGRAVAELAAYVRASTTNVHELCSINVRLNDEDVRRVRGVDNVLNNVLPCTMPGWRSHIVDWHDRAYAHV